MANLIKRFQRAGNIVLGREPAPTLNEIGASGSVIFSGILDDAEYLKDLQGDKGRVALR